MPSETLIFAVSGLAGSSRIPASRSEEAFPMVLFSSLLVAAVLSSVISARLKHPPQSPCLRPVVSVLFVDWRLAANTHQNSRILFAPMAFVRGDRYWRAEIPQSWILRGRRLGLRYARWWPGRRRPRDRNGLACRAHFSFSKGVIINAAAGETNTFWCSSPNRRDRCVLETEIKDLGLPFVVGFL